MRANYNASNETSSNYLFSEEIPQLSEETLEHVKAPSSLTATKEITNVN